ncbi:MAG: hypothetical protein ABIJ34_09145 [archaeon]
MGMKELAVIVGIAVIFTAFVMVTVDVFVPRPEYNKFCRQDYYPEKAFPVVNNNCTYVETAAERACYDKEGMGKFDVDENGCRYFKDCDMCNKEFNDSQKAYTNTIFIILAIVGAIAILLGVYYKVEFIGTGFMFSGILLMFIGTVQNFDALNKYTRPVVLFAELALIMFIAYKKVMKK